MGLSVKFLVGLFRAIVAPEDVCLRKIGKDRKVHEVAWKNSDMFVFAVATLLKTFR